MEIEIQTKDGSKTVKAIEILPGLAIHHTLYEDGFKKSSWTLTHIPSGTAIMQSVRRSRKNIIEKAKKHLGHLDWEKEIHTETPLEDYIEGVNQLREAL